MISEKQYKFTPFPPIKNDELPSFKSQLEKTFQCMVPTEYVEIFGVSNGMIFDNVVFYGSKSQKRLDYELPSIFEINEVLERIDKDEAFIIGKWLNLIIIYDGRDLKYKIVSKINFIENKSFSSFYDMLKYVKNAIE